MPRLLFVRGVYFLQALIQAFSADTDFQTIVTGLKSEMKEQLIAGLTGSSRQVMLASLARELERPLFVVTHNMFAAQKIAEDLLECLSPDEVLLYPISRASDTEKPLQARRC